MSQSDEVANAGAYEANLHFLRRLRQQVQRFTIRRPRRVFELLLRLIGPDEPRRIVRTENGVLAYINPYNEIGRHILETGSYEKENEALFRNYIQYGDAVLDVGANEGVCTALFGILVGTTGTVVAVEPQSRLRDLIEINCRLNNLPDFRVFRNALGDEPGTTARIALYSALNSGMSSFAKRYHSTTGYEDVTFTSIEHIMNQCGIQRFNFVKVDTEGFEVEVVKAMMPVIRNGGIDHLYVDYHDQILIGRGIDGNDLHDSILAAGMAVSSGSRQLKNSYILYSRHGVAGARPNKGTPANLPTR